MKKAQGIAYWRTLQTEELIRVLAMVKDSIKYGFDLIEGDTTVQDVETVLKERNVM